ncbi:unnamed protein product [Protopolystoma xenopodis]|uniref:Uncharacterized protein n=1 Tax=Protopolystoma xenopodis TaxID=117903 RepID=A0A448WHM3_9PLAT|nr:unnamed protein product [Protopolystoma xenopodis]
MMDDLRADAVEALLSFCTDDQERFTCSHEAGTILKPEDSKQDSYGGQDRENSLAFQETYAATQIISSADEVTFPVDNYANLLMGEENFLEGDSPDNVGLENRMTSSPCGPIPSSNSIPESLDNRISFSPDNIQTLLLNNSQGNARPWLESVRALPSFHTLFGRNLSESMDVSARTLPPLSPTHYEGWSSFQEPLIVRDSLSSSMTAQLSADEDPISYPRKRAASDTDLATFSLGQLLSFSDGGLLQNNKNAPKNEAILMHPKIFGLETPTPHAAIASVAPPLPANVPLLLIKQPSNCSSNSFSSQDVDTPSSLSAVVESQGTSSAPDCSELSSSTSQHDVDSIIGQGFPHARTSFPVGHRTVTLKVTRYDSTRPATLIPINTSNHNLVQSLPAIQHLPEPNTASQSVSLPLVGSPCANSYTSSLPASYLSSSALSYSIVNESKPTTSSNDPLAESHPSLEGPYSSPSANMAINCGISKLDVHSISNSEKCKDPLRSDEAKVRCYAGSQYRCPIKESRFNRWCSTPRNKPLNRNAVDTMELWYQAHVDFPYPTTEEKLDIARRGSVTLSQVVKALYMRLLSSINFKVWPTNFLSFYEIKYSIYILTGAR